MVQEFFEIPLGAWETDYFRDVPRYNNAESRLHTAMDEHGLLLDNRPFYARRDPALIHWQTGWSLILPKGSKCPNLTSDQGICLIYKERPKVCRRPQLFPYIIEPLNREKNHMELYRLRQALLAVTECPYVTTLRDEIADYAAACELELIMMRNKQ